MKMYFKNVFFVLSATVSTVGYFGAKRLLCSTVLWQTDQWGCNSSKYDQHFRLFASREYCGVLYMTPNDFLQSLFQEKPPTSQLNSLSPDEVKTILQKAGHCGSKNLFRKLGNQGLISFTDYLFLLGLLNKPSSRYEVAFDILDTDYSGAIDANEFSMLYGVSAGAPDQMQLTHDRLSLYPQGNLSDQSTLMRVFFGKDGKQLLKKEDFYKYNIIRLFLLVDLSKIFKMKSSRPSLLFPLQMVQPSLPLILLGCYCTTLTFPNRDMMNSYRGYVDFQQMWRFSYFR